jgi:hypothetical protein
MSEESEKKKRRDYAIRSARRHHELIIRSDRQSRVVLRDAQPSAEYVELKDHRGGYYLIPLSALDEGEQAVFQDPNFFEATMRGLQDIAEGRVKSLDWVTDFTDA